MGRRSEYVPHFRLTLLHSAQVGTSFEHFLFKRRHEVQESSACVSVIVLGLGQHLRWLLKCGREDGHGRINRHVGVSKAAAIQPRKFTIVRAYTALYLTTQQHLNACRRGAPSHCLMSLERIAVLRNFTQSSLQSALSQPLDLAAWCKSQQDIRQINPIAHQAWIPPSDAACWNFQLSFESGSMKRCWRQRMCFA